MLGKILKSIFKTGKKAKESVENSMDFLEDVIEKEYIVGSIQKVKDASGDIVEKAGTVYQKTKDKIDENLSVEKLKENVDAAIDKAQKMTSEFSDDMLENSDTIKNVINEGKQFVDKLLGEEE